ncbi:MAG: MFS transporter, partial [Chroococcidiopsidaceae cyanobacterium CP_BM_RX_35]|nr:MFS transporter [Chroococcidiopsidaceae cyanobacterium CP_BM_RX_35]
MNRVRFQFVITAVACLAICMANLDNTAVSLMLPEIQTDLGFNLLGQQWILNTYTLAAASSVLISGTLGDVYGRKRVFITGLTIFMMASLVCGLSPNLGILLAGRTLQGIGAAVLIPNSLFILADTFPKPKEK